MSLEVAQVQGDTTRTRADGLVLEDRQSKNLVVEETDGRREKRE